MSDLGVFGISAVIAAAFMGVAIYKACDVSYDMLMNSMDSSETNGAFHYDTEEFDFDMAM